MNVWGQKVDDDKVTKKQMSITLFPRNELNVESNSIISIQNNLNMIDNAITIDNA